MTPLILTAVGLVLLVAVGLHDTARALRQLRVRHRIRRRRRQLDRWAQHRGEDAY